MNESVAKSLRGANSQSFDMEEFETRLRSSQPRPPAQDPLAELANLVNSAEDPFADLFADPAAARALTAGAAAQPVHTDSSGASAGAGNNYLAPEQNLAGNGAEMLRSVAQQMHQPGLQSPSAAAPLDFHTPLESQAPLESHASLALRGTFAPGQPDPVDEFERSIVQLVAARGGAEPVAGEQPAATGHDYQQSIPGSYQAPTAQDHYAQVPGPYADQLENEPAQQGYQHVDASPDQNSIHGSSQGMSDPYAGAYSDAPPTAVRPAVPPDWHGHDHVPNGSYGQRAQKKAGSRKSLYLTGSAIGVLVVGIGAALALWDNGTPAGKIPTITASGDTMKIKADGVSEKTVRTVSILQPGKSAPAAKVVSSGEQPIDLAQVPDEPKKARRIKEEELSKKLNLADRNLTRPIARSAPDIKARTNSGGYFPEPRKVRTVMVRPDGSLIDPTASIQPKPVAAPVVRMPRQAAPARVEQNSRTRSVATLASRKAAPRVRTISRAAARPVPPAANRTAALDLTPKRISRTPASGGGFAVQLAAPASESAARSVASKAKARFGSVFAGRSPSIQQAVVKSRTVYRVRVGGLSRGDASKMCSQVKAKGGNCYVARN